MMERKDNDFDIDGSEIDYRWKEDFSSTARGQLLYYWFVYLLKVAAGFIVGLIFCATFRYLLVPPAILMCAASVIHRSAVLNNSIVRMKLPIFFSIWASLWIVCILYFYGFNFYFDFPAQTVFLDNCIFALLSGTPPLLIYFALKRGYSAYKQAFHKEELVRINYNFRRDLLEEE